MTSLVNAALSLMGTVLAFGAWTVSPGVATAQSSDPGSSASFVNWLRNTDEGEPPYGDGDGQGTRPIDGTACIVSLHREEVERLWDDRPVFLVQGVDRRLAVFEADSDTPLWTYPVNNHEAVVYSGPELQPGQVYTLRVQVQLATYATRDFQVVNAAEWEAIAAELVTVSATVAADGGSLADVAIARADFFWSQGLGADAWREIAVAQQLSPTAADAVEFAYSQLCGTADS